MTTEKPYSSVYQGYKVVRVLADRYISSWVFPGDSVVYNVGQWTVPRPNGGPLTLFAKESYARDYVEKVKWMSATDNYEIFPCEWIPWNSKLPRYPELGLNRPAQVWSIYGWPGIFDNVSDWKGIRLARAVRLVKEN